MEIAAQLYTIREFTKTPGDVRSALKKIAEIGYKSVQVSGFGPIEPQLLKEYLDENKLTVCATHMPFDRIINDTDKLIEEHKLWNCKYIGLGSMPGEYKKDKASYDEFIKIIRPAAEKIRAAGLKFLYHNHRCEFARIDGDMNGMEYLAQNLPADICGFLVDFYWVQAGGGMPVEFIERYADRLHIVHFKDMTVSDDAIEMAEIGRGNMDYKPIYDACIRAGVEVAAVEQDKCRTDPFECLKTSLDNIKKFM